MTLGIGNSGTCRACGQPGVLISLLAPGMSEHRDYRHEKECHWMDANGTQTWAHGPVTHYWVPGHWVAFPEHAYKQ